MNPFDWFGGLFGDVPGYFQDFTQYLLQEILVFLQNLVGALLQIFSIIANLFKAVLKALKRAAQAVLNFFIHTLWQEFQKWYTRFKSWVTWYRVHVLGPLDQAYRNLLHLYDRFFRPLIGFIDDVRRLTQLIAIFNRKLAAAIDSAFYSLESRLMGPLLSAVQRINLLTSYQTAVLTVTGRFDASIFASTIRRDVGTIRAALFGFPWNDTAPAHVPDSVRVVQVKANFEQYLSSRSGPTADDVASLHGVFVNTYSALKA